jgi:glycopeptide antibiotics resistance protein
LGLAILTIMNDAAPKASANKPPTVSVGKMFSRSVFAAYLLILLWLVLFKFSYDPFGVIRDFHVRTLNLIPFAMAHRSEMVSNIVVFIPFGLMLGVCFSELRLRSKLAIILGFSFGVEVVQFLLAIGVSDITDVIMNGLGGLLGIVGYQAASKLTKQESLERSIAVMGAIILLAVLYLRVFVFMVRY